MRSILYLGLILINICGDWIGQPVTSQSRRKIKQNGIIICIDIHSGLVGGRMRTISKIQSI